MGDYALGVMAFLGRFVGLSRYEEYTLVELIERVVEERTKKIRRIVRELDGKEGKKSS